jgi:hypothetical protein
MQKTAAGRAETIGATTSLTQPGKTRRGQRSRRADPTPQVPVTIRAMKL